MLLKNKLVGVIEGNNVMKMSYNKSCELALASGYEKVIDDKAFKGSFFIKNEKIWIHDIIALKNHLNIDSDKELESLGYDMKNYHSYKDYTNAMADQEMKELYNAITHCEGEATYLSDGMWLLPDGTMEER